MMINLEPRMIFINRYIKKLKNVLVISYKLFYFNTNKFMKNINFIVKQNNSSYSLQIWKRKKKYHFWNNILILSLFFMKVQQYPI